MNIARRQIGPHQPPYVIAELGVNHNGSVSRALDMTNAAAEAGADAIKLQYFQTDLLLSRAAKLALYQEQGGADDPYSMLRELELDIDSLTTLAQHAASLNIHAIVTVFSVELVDLAQEIAWDAYKTASPDIINKQLIETLIATGRPLIISTGAATYEEAERATRWLGTHPHIMMQCVSAYPTPDENAALAGRGALEKINPNALGYSDHTTAVDTGALAVASGACILEKHLTYDRQADGPDHRASLDPAQFAQYVRLTHRAWRMLGESEKIVLPIEHDVRNVSRQSIVTTRALKRGDVLRAEHLTIKRPGTGFQPWQLEDVIGRTIRQPIDADMPLTEEHLK